MKTTFDACDIWIICWSLFGIIGFILTRLPGIFKRLERHDTELVSVGFTMCMISALMYVVAVFAFTH